MEVEAKKPEFKYIVRITEVDLDGNRTLLEGLTKIRGIGARLSGVIVNILGIDKYKKIGNLTDDEIEKLKDVVSNLDKNLPAWILNRQKEIYTGKNMHVLESDLKLAVKDDIDLMKKIRCYKGIRHEKGLKVRGQRTKTHGRTGLSVGVVRKALKKPFESEKKEKKEKKEEKEEKEEKK